MNLKRFFCLLLCLMCFTSSSLAVSKGFTLRNGDRDVPRVAITMDDCQDTEKIRETIELCKEYGIAVTFFVVGNGLKVEDRQLWQDALDAGCEIGNHTWSHSDLPHLKTSLIQYEMEQSQKQLDEVLGYHYPMQVMRPPWGHLSRDSKKISDKRVVDAIEGCGYKHAVKWDVSQTNAEKAIKQVKNGSILLYHSNAADVTCLKTLIPALLEKGLECVTVSELLNLDPVQVSPLDEETSL